MEENKIYIVPSNELKKFRIGTIRYLVKNIDGFWTMGDGDINEHFREITPVYRLFNTVSEATRYKLSI